MPAPGVLRWDMLRWGLLQALLCVVLVPGVAATTSAAEAVAQVDYRIAPGALSPALQQWARQSGIALVFDARELADLRTSGVAGSLAPAAALKQLVAGMPVNILQTPSGGFVVRRHAAPPAVVAQPVRRPPPPAPAKPVQVELAPIHVTGSRLPRTSVQTTLPVTVIDREDILRSGYGTLFDLLRHLPGMNGHPPLSTSRSGDSIRPPAAAVACSIEGMGEWVFNMGWRGGWASGGPILGRLWIGGNGQNEISSQARTRHPTPSLPWPDTFQARCCPA